VNVQMQRRNAEQFARRPRGRGESSIGYIPVRTKDGAWLQHANQRVPHIQRHLEAIGLAHLLGDERFARVPAISTENRELLRREILKKQLEKTADEWMEIYLEDGEIAAEPYREDAPTEPLSVYGRSKLAGEKAVRAVNPEHVILRTAWVYSPFGRNFVRTMLTMADRQVLRVVDDQRGCPTSALDFAEAILQIAGRWQGGDRTGLGETFHLAGGGSASWFDFAVEIMDQCRRLGLPTAEVRPIATADWPTKAMRPANAVLNCSKIERDLGLRLPEWRRSVAETVERLAAIEGHGMKEVAALLGLPEGTVKSRLFDARKRLQERWQ